MSETFPKFPNHPGVKQEKQEAHHGSIEYYKAKENSIRRHLNHALRIVLANLANTDQKAYERDSSPDKGGLHDALDLKTQVVTFDLPDIQQFNTLEEFQDAAKNSYKLNKQTNEHIRRLQETKGEAAVDAFLLEDDRLFDEAKEYFERIRSGKVSGLKTYGNGSTLDTIKSDDYRKGGRVYRINIKAASTDRPVYLVKQLSEKLSENSDSLPAGFQIKTLLGDTNSRDSVIVYVPESSFDGAAKIVAEHFQGNWQYHDRHADDGIFGGVALETPDKSKFPGIRVAVDPPTLEPPVEDTFNGLQAHILSLSVIEYVKQYYHGDKDTMIGHFRSDFDTAEQLWNAHFARLYEKHVNAVLGPKASMKNIAFFEE
ncbi:MAG: hypothetical protein WA082_03400 [Candidatus Moraniibacteriota bacterium]